MKENKINYSEIEIKAQEIIKLLNGYTIEEIQDVTFKVRELARSVKLTF